VITIENDTFLRAARGQRTSRTPIWMMRQAGRVLPEYRAVREKHSFLDVARIPELCAEVSVQPVERLDVDAAILFSDILLPFAAMGIGVDFQPGPVLERAYDPESGLSQLLEFLKGERAELGEGFQSTYVDNLDVQLDGVDDLSDKTVATLTFTGVAKTSRFDQGEAFSESWRLEREAGDSQPWLVAGIRQNG
jgi:hypothetical protein